MAIVEVTRGGVTETAPSRRGAVESFEGRAEVRRIRLTGDEARILRYTLSEWSGDSGLASTMGAQLEKLAQLPDLLPRRRRAEYDDYYDVPKGKRTRGRGKRRVISCIKTADLFGALMGTDPDREDRVADRRRPMDIGSDWHRAWFADSQEMYVPKGHHVPADHMGSMERWCDKKVSDKEDCLRCWRALKLLGSRRSPAVVVLQALYGDVAPGLISSELAWALWRSLGEDYRRTLRYAPSSGESAARFEEKLKIDEKARPNEGSNAHKARVAEQHEQKRKLLSDVARECEFLIVNAANAYRAAMREV